MTRSASRSRARADRANIYDEITSRIIGELEAGRLPWVQPWGSSAVAAPLAMAMGGASRPHCIVYGRHYHQTARILASSLWPLGQEHSDAGDTLVVI